MTNFLPERQADKLSDRRKRIDRDLKPEFDQAYYGKGPHTEAGKGDARRLTDSEMYALGWEAAFGATSEIRAAARERWLELKKRRRHDRDQQAAT